MNYQHRGLCSDQARRFGPGPAGDKPAAEAEREVDPNCTDGSVLARLDLKQLARFIFLEAL